MHILRGTTFTTQDASAAARRLEAWMDYVIVEEGVIEPRLAASWNAPATAGAAYSLCQPASGTEGFIRLIEGPAVADYRPLRTFGWAAAELCVQDVEATHERLKSSPFEVIGPPQAVDGLPTIYPMQVKGPDQEILYLTQILNTAPDSGLPQALSAIDKTFILVLACSDLDQTSAWFRHQLNLQVGAPLSIAYDLINEAFGLPITQHHRLATGKWQGQVCLEFDQYPAEATVRPGPANALPVGISICTLAHPAFDQLSGDWISPPKRQEGRLYSGAKVGVLRTPDGALVEVVDQG